MVIDIAHDQSGSQAEKCKADIQYSIFSNIYMQAIDDIMHDHEFKDLSKFQLRDQDWKLLADYQEILAVVLIYFILDFFLIISIPQIPHAFQDILGAEKIPTLCHSIPAFAAFIQLWKDLAEERPEWEEIIQPGLDKLEDYQDRLTDVHIIAMGECLLIFYIPVCSSQLQLGIDPGNKLSFLRERSDEEYERAKKIFLKAVSFSLNLKLYFTQHYLIRFGLMFLHRLLLKLVMLHLRLRLAVKNKLLHDQQTFWVLARESKLWLHKQCLLNKKLTSISVTLTVEQALSNSGRLFDFLSHS